MLMFLFIMERRILISISKLTVVHDDIDALVSEGEKDSN